MRLKLLLVFAFVLNLRAQDDYKPGPDSIAQAGVPKGQLIKGSYTAKDGSVFPGTERGYDIYLPPDFDKEKPAPFMVFQDGVIYNAPVVFDNLIAKHDIPPLIGIFIRPGVVPAANPNALPRYNRSYEYDSVSDTYARFLIDEFLPAIEAKHGLKLSTDPNDAAISGISSGGICAFMAAWHRPDRIRRVFSGVGTYVGIHGADQLPVLVRKMEPKPLRIYLQSGEHDNDLYCGDWWMANQTMERALTWAGYDVAHTWGTGGHNAKHATAIFPDVLRWLWRDFSTAKEIKPNPRGESKWVGYSVLGDGKWEAVTSLWQVTSSLPYVRKDRIPLWEHLTANSDGIVFASEPTNGVILRISYDGNAQWFGPRTPGASGMAVLPDGKLLVCVGSAGQAYKLGEKPTKDRLATIDPAGNINMEATCDDQLANIALTRSGERYVIGTQRSGGFSSILFSGPSVYHLNESGQIHSHNLSDSRSRGAAYFALSPDQTQLYVSIPGSREVELWKLAPMPEALVDCQAFVKWEENLAPKKFAREHSGGICVDTNGWLYIATSSGIQVCDQAGRVNFIIPTPQIPSDVCFGGKDLGELYIECEEVIHKRPTKAHGIVSGQMAPIKPAPPKL